MKHTFVKHFFIAGLALALAACGRAAGTASTPAEITITQADAGKTINLAKNDILVLTLPGNPTTGYAWELQPAPDESVLQVAGEPQFVEQDSTKLGSPGAMVFHFTAVGAGQTAVKLVYHRSWETGTPPQDTFEVNVKVR
ncbi:MAG TPA: protease inhibitor I42 family protein [Anaerolineaceae bacterium]